MRSRQKRREVRRAFKEACRLTAQGDYAEALEKHILYYENILEVQPASAGVRVSFALGRWIELGEKYPPALDALRKIRNSDTQEIEGGLLDINLLHGIVRINDFLGDTNATVTLFKQIILQDDDFAVRVYDFVKEALLEHREFELLRKYMGDPMKKLKEERSYYRELRILEWLFFFRRRPLREARRNTFILETIVLITILRQSGEKEIARTIRDEALKTLDAPEIRDALARKAY